MICFVGVLFRQLGQAFQLRSYSFRSLFIRRGSSLMTALGIALTVAVFSGVFALKSGVDAIYTPIGSDNIAIYLRQGSTSEGESGLTRETVETLMKERKEILSDGGRPLAASESFLAVFMPKIDGGRTNVPIRGIDEMSLRIADSFRIVEGREIELGNNEVIVGFPLKSRVENCQVGDTVVLNTTPFEVVGIFEVEGAQRGEIWAPAERMMQAMQRPVFQRVIARVHNDTDFERIAGELDEDPRFAVTVQSEQDYLSSQTTMLGGVLTGLALFLTLIMGSAAALGAMNTMLAAVSARTHEVGVLLAIGYGRLTVFCAFLMESAFLGLLGAIIGCVLVLPFNGIETGAMNFNTFTDISFKFQVTASSFLASAIIAVGLGTLGGVIPAFLASRKKPIEALRRR